MKIKVIPVAALLTLFLFSCQREIDDTISGGGGGGSTPGTDGDLLVKALQVTPATNDTNTITFQWDANKRLIEYKSAGKVNGIATDILHKITRLPDGKIKNIVYKSSLAAGGLDSIVYVPYYNGNRLAYVIDTQYSIIGEIRDSIAFNYTGDRISSKDVYMDLFGFVVHTVRETYTYDANGNILTQTALSPNGTGGFDPVSVATHVYSTHKNMVVLGEESYIAIGAANVSKNFATSISMTSSGGAGSYTSTFSQVAYNSFDRPREATVTVTPQPPGYTMKVTMFYQ